MTSNQAPFLSGLQTWEQTSSERPLRLTEYLPDPLELTDFSPEEAQFSFHEYPPFPRPWRQPIKSVCWTIELLFGLASLVLLLAMIAAIPLLNIVALGYLLEAQGRVARTGKLRYAVPLLPLAPRLGTIGLGIYLWLIPIRIVADITTDAKLVGPGSAVAIAWQFVLLFVTAGITVHLLLALARGGGFWCFFRPLKNAIWLAKQLWNGSYLDTSAQAVGDFFSALRLRHHFSLGLRGLFGTFLWLLIPTALYAVLRNTDRPGQVLMTLIGGVLLCLTLTWVPFLQAHFAAQNRFSAFAEWRAVRELNRRAPLGWMFATILLYALALPLYLFKIAAPPQDALWFITLIFVVTIYPAKIAIGWAYGAAVRRDRRANVLLRWTCTLLLMPLVGFYVLMLFFTPAIGAAGRSVLFEHHALLLPVPF